MKKKDEGHDCHYTLRITLVLEFIHSYYSIETIFPWVDGVDFKLIQYNFASREWNEKTMNYFNPTEPFGLNLFIEPNKIA